MLLARQENMFRVSIFFKPEQSISIRVTTYSDKRHNDIQLGIRVTNSASLPLFTTCNTDTLRTFAPIDSGYTTHTISIPAKLFPPGDYRLDFVSHTPLKVRYDYIECPLTFTILNINSHVTALNDRRAGALSPLLDWQKIQSSQ